MGVESRPRQPVRFVFAFASPSSCLPPLSFRRVIVAHLPARISNSSNSPSGSSLRSRWSQVANLCSISCQPARFCRVFGIKHLSRSSH